MTSSEEPFRGGILSPSGKFGKESVFFDSFSADRLT